MEKMHRLNPISSRNRKGKESLLIKVILVLIVLVIAFYLPTRGIYIASKRAIAGSKIIAAGVKQENLDQIKNGVTETKSAVSDLNGSLNWFIWLKIIPFAGGYYGDIRHFSLAAENELQAVNTIISFLDPYKNELGLTGQVTPGQDRIAQVVKMLDKILPMMDKIEPDLKKARGEVEGIDTSKYPEKLGSQNLRSRLEEIKNMIIGTHIVLTEHKNAVLLLPDALGQSQPKNYLLLFQNDKELRPTGGFLTAYAFLTLDKGHLTTTASDDIYRLDERLLKVCLNKICPLTPPAPIVKYLPEVTGKPRTTWSIRDSNISPDLPTAADQFEKLYSYLEDGIRFDGIVTIDTQVVEELLAITGPVDIFGTPYSADLDHRCNCPNVIYELEHYAEIASKGEQDRKAVLGTLMQQILAKTLGAGPDKLPTFINTGIKLANDKHIMFALHDQKIQSELGRLGWTGEIKQTDGDYLHINDANFAGGKSNLYVEEKVTVDINIGADGLAKHKVVIEYKNPQPFNTWLNGILRDYVRVYVPTGSKLISSKGSDDPVASQEDKALNKNYFEAFITVRPQNSRTLSFEYTTPTKLSNKTLPLLIQKQPGAKDHRYIVRLNGNQKAEFNLTSDKVLNLSF